MPPARVCFFKPSSLAKGILFANFSPFSLAKGILFADFRPFSLGKGILFGNFGPFSLAKVYFLPIFAHLVWARVYFLAILVKEMSKKTSVIPVKRPIFFKFWSLECKNLASFASNMPIHGTLM